MANSSPMGGGGRVGEEEEGGEVGGRGGWELKGGRKIEM